MIGLLAKFSTLAAVGLFSLAALPSLKLHHAPEPEKMLQLQLPSGKFVRFARFEVSRAEWKVCFEAGSCSDIKSARGSKNLDLPITGVNYFDAQDYLRWINSTSGHHYRLPTQEEWLAAAVDVPKPVSKKLFEDPRLAWAADYGTMPAVSPVLKPRGGFGTEANGISDLRGNVWEWTSTCVVAGEKEEDCPAFYAAGLHMAEMPEFVREPAVGGCASGTPPAHLGIRLIED